MEHRIINKIRIGSLIILLVLTASIILNSCYYDNEAELYQFTTINCDTNNVIYTGTIAPILQSNCNSCHSQTTASGGIITVGYNNLIIVVNNGKFLGSVSHLAGFSFMPKNGQKLSDCNLAKIRKWINLGAPNN